MREGGGAGVKKKQTNYEITVYEAMPDISGACPPARGLGVG